MRSFLNIFVIVIFSTTIPKCSSNEISADYWMDIGQDILKDHLKVNFKTEDNKKAENIILVIGSGMSLTTLRAAEIISSSDKYTSLNSFPVVGFAKTHCSDAQVPDEACSATSLSTGIKGKTNVVGLVENKSSKGIQSIAQWALSAGKDVGLVTTSRITHPSIAAMYGRAPNSDWEADVDLPKSEHNKYSCLDLACQLIHGKIGQKIKAIFGGGRTNFLPRSSHLKEGRRGDDRNLINDWINIKENENVKYEYVGNRDDLLNIGNDTEYVLGLFSDDHMQFNKLKDDDEEPSLEEMVMAALKILSKNKKGYFLFILGGRIDHAHHDNRPILAIDETIQLFHTVETMQKNIDQENTLLVVTSDHGNTMTISGYPGRKSDDILGRVNSTKDGVFYSIPVISYANGPGYKSHAAEESSHKPLDRYPAGYFMEKETHGGEMVAVFAKGPWQELLIGTYDSDFIPNVICYAACIGPGNHSCKQPFTSSSTNPYHNLNRTLILLLFSLYIFRP